MENFTVVNLILSQSGRRASGYTNHGVMEMTAGDSFATYATMKISMRMIFVVGAELI